MAAAKSRYLAFTLAEKQGESIVFRVDHLAKMSVFSPGLSTAKSIDAKEVRNMLFGTDFNPTKPISRIIEILDKFRIKKMRKAHTNPIDVFTILTEDGELYLLAPISKSVFGILTLYSSNTTLPPVVFDDLPLSNVAKSREGKYYFLDLEHNLYFPFEEPKEETISFGSDFKQSMYFLIKNGKTVILKMSSVIPDHMTHIGDTPRDHYLNYETMLTAETDLALGGVFAVDTFSIFIAFGPNLAFCEMEHGVGLAQFKFNYTWNFKDYLPFEIVKILPYEDHYYLLMKDHRIFNIDKRKMDGKWETGFKHYDSLIDFDFYDKSYALILNSGTIFFSFDGVSGEIVPSIKPSHIFIGAYGLMYY